LEPKYLGGPGQHLGGPVPPGPNVEPPIFGHVARMSPNIPAHQALRLQVEASVDRRPDRDWVHSSGRPRNRWIDQLHQDHPPNDLWRAAIRRGHTGATLRSSTTTRWRRPSSYWLVIFSRNRVSAPGSKIPYPIPNTGNYYCGDYVKCQFTFSTAIIPPILARICMMHLFTTLNSIVGSSVHSRLHIHKLRRSITCNALISEYPEPTQAVVFRYLLRSDGIWNRVRVIGC